MMPISIMAQQVSKTELNVGSNMRVPVTVKTNKGTYQVYNTMTIDGVVNVLSATDAGGNKIVVNSEYKSKSGQDNHGKRYSYYTRIYNFKTLYGSNTSSTTSSDVHTRSNSYNSDENRARRAAKRAAYQEAEWNRRENEVFSFSDEIDLGLPSGNIWCGYNLGADTPIETGDFYAWGELQTKSIDRFQYMYYFDYYNEYLNYGKSPKHSSLIPQHDVVYMKWGDGWQMPSKKDFEELLQYCKWTKYEYQGVKGWRGKGPSGKLIFFPIKGKYINGFLEVKKDNYISSYWTRDINDNDEAEAYTLTINHNGYSVKPSVRFLGCLIRPVKKSTSLIANPSILASMKVKPAHADEEMAKERAEDIKRQLEDVYPTYKCRKDPYSINARFENNTLFVDGVAYPFVLVEGGTFKMGAGKEQGKEVNPNEKPQHKVTLDSYYIGETEVTTALWIQIMGYSNRHEYKTPAIMNEAELKMIDKELISDGMLVWVSDGWDAGYYLYNNGGWGRYTGRRPDGVVQLKTKDIREIRSKGKKMPSQYIWDIQIEDKYDWIFKPEKEDENKVMRHVSWNECQTFIDALNKATGLKFHLPTEAQWEYAAKGGKYSKGYKYSGSNDYNEVVNLEGLTKQAKPNELGIYDMCGSAREWCQDSYYTYTKNDQINPLFTTTDTNKILKYYTDYRVTIRDYARPNYSEYTGFRLVISAL